jgi:hypothetical protein
VERKYSGGPRKGRYGALAAGGAALLLWSMTLPVDAKSTEAANGDPAQQEAAQAVGTAAAAQGPFTVVANDYSFEGVPRKVKAFEGLTDVTLENVSESEAHEIVFVRLKDEKQNRNFTLRRAKMALAAHFNFEAQEDSDNVGGFTPGFPSAPAGLRDPTMGNRAEVFKTSFGGEKTHEVEAVPPGEEDTNGVDLSRPGRYLFFCPITALAENDPHQEPHYLQSPGQIGFLEVVD